MQMKAVWDFFWIAENVKGEGSTHSWDHSNHLGGKYTSQGPWSYASWKSQHPTKLFPWVAWQCLRIFVWSAAGILSHFPMCLKSQAWFGLEHFLSWNEKKEHNFFSRLLGNSSLIGVPSLQLNRPAFVKSFPAGLTFCFFLVRSRVGVPGGEASGLTFRAAISAMGATAFIILGFASRGWSLGRSKGPCLPWCSYRCDDEVNFQVTSVASMLD